MAGKPTFTSTKPVETNTFAAWRAERAEQERAMLQRQVERMESYGADPKEIQKVRRRMERTDVLPAAFDAPAMVDNVAVAAIKRAFMLARTSHRNWQSHKRYGRLDRRAGPRADQGQVDVFKYKSGQSTTMLKVAVMLDASGSMAGGDARIVLPGTHRKVDVSRREAAALFGATVAKALGSIPTVSLDVYEHSAAHGGLVQLKWRWHRGTPLGVFNEGANRGFGVGGNADGHALMAVARRMNQTLKRDERGLILMVSDGLPADYTTDGKSNAGQALIDAVREVRAMGIEVIAVAIDGSDQSTYYGDGMVPFTGSWLELGRALADHVGKALAAERRR